MWRPGCTENHVLQFEYIQVRLNKPEKRPINKTIKVGGPNVNSKYDRPIEKE